MEKYNWIYKVKKKKQNPHLREGPWFSERVPPENCFKFAEVVVCAFQVSSHRSLHLSVSSGVDVSKRPSEGFCIVVGFKGIVKEKHPHPHSGIIKAQLQLIQWLAETWRYLLEVCLGVWILLCLKEEFWGLHSCRHSQFSCFRHKETFENNLGGSLLGRPAICRRTRPDASRALGNQTKIPQ